MPKMQSRKWQVFKTISRWYKFLMNQYYNLNRLFSKNLVVVLLLLTLTSLACGLGGSSKQIEPPGGSIPVSQEAADRLKQNFYQALQEAGGNHESQLRITNEEITSLVAIELTQTGQIPVSDPQVWFTAGRIYMTSKVQLFGPLKFDSIIVATAVVDGGQMLVRVQEAQMGPFDFPDRLIESTTQTINETLTGILVGADLEITRLEILEGEMFVVGTRKTL
jgi:hypothetical protein